MAFFVEGQTELLFVNKLLKEMAGAKNIQVRLERKVRKNKFRFLKAISKNNINEYYILIRDCMGDSSVKSEIIDNYNSLEIAGHEKIVGIRDVFPVDKNDISKLESNLNFGLPTEGIQIQIILAEMEIEAWFLAEATHYSRIDSSITLAKVVSNLSFDPTKNHVEERIHPSKDLDDIYKLAGKSYKKKKTNCLRTVNALDYSVLYLVVSKRVPRLKMLIECIDHFFSA